jgi:hypothetical protein
VIAPIADRSRVPMTSLERLFSFPDPVNEVAARLVAGAVVLMAVATLTLDLE